MPPQEYRLLVRSAAVILVFFAVRDVECGTLPTATTTTVPPKTTAVAASTTTASRASIPPTTTSTDLSQVTTTASSTSTTEIYTTTGLFACILKALIEFLVDTLVPADFTFTLTVEIKSKLINACLVAKFTKLKHSFAAEFNVTVQMPILPVNALQIHGSGKLNLDIEHFPKVPGSKPPQHRDSQGNVYTRTGDGWDVEGNNECSCSTRPTLYE